MVRDMMKHLVREWENVRTVGAAINGWLLHVKSHVVLVCCLVDELLTVLTIKFSPCNKSQIDLKGIYYPWFQIVYRDKRISNRLKKLHNIIIIDKLTS